MGSYGWIVTGTQYEDNFIAFSFSCSLIKGC